MRTLDWKYPQMIWGDSFSRPHVVLRVFDGDYPHRGVLIELQRMGYTLATTRRLGWDVYAILIKDGWYWVVRLPCPINGTRPLCVVRSDIEYSDDDEIVDV